MSVFKKVIGQPQSESNHPLPSAPAGYRQPETLVAPPNAPNAPVVTPTQQVSISRPPSGASRNILSTDVEIKGTVKFTNDLIVDGKIEGEISSDGSLTVGENARLKAEIKTATVVVYGKVHGNITALDRIELKSSAEVIGDIKAKTLSIEAGAIFVGRSTVGTPAQAPAQAPPAQGGQQGGQGQQAAKSAVAGGPKQATFPGTA